MSGYTGAQPNNGNASRADERQARADAAKALMQRDIYPGIDALEVLALWILTGEPR